MRDWAIIVISFHLASRLAYVIGVGIALTLQDKHQRLTRNAGPHEAFRKFRRVAAWLMTTDCVSFVFLCVMTPFTLHTPIHSSALVVAGVALVVIGVWMKTWAAIRIGWEACYWHNFFFPGECPTLDPPGPYRFLKNPMYTLGYAYTYGLALIFGSLPGLIFALFDQAAILAFYHRVEKPHWESIAEAAYHGGASGD